MKKKIVICLAIILFLGFCQIMLIPAKRNIFDYAIRYAKGEYDTYIYVADKGKNRQWMKTFYCKGTYYIYSTEKKAIYEYHSQKKILSMPQEPEWMTASEEYIYYSVDHVLYQYDYEGALIASRRFLNNEHIFKLYAEDENVYCSIWSDDSPVMGLIDIVYIFDAKDISKAGNIGNIDLKLEKISNTNGSNEELMDECWIQRLKMGWIVAIRNPNMIQIDYRKDAVKIYTQDSAEGFFEIVSAVSRENVSKRYEVLCMEEDKLCTLPEERACVINRNGQINIIEGKGEEWCYSDSVVDDRYLIVLLEKYFGGDGRLKPEGSAGDYFGSQILSINLDTCELEWNALSEEQVVYMDKDRYATLKDGVIKFYRMKDNVLVRTKEIAEYETGKSYQVEICHDKLFVFCDKELLDVVDVL